MDSFEKDGIKYKVVTGNVERKIFIHQVAILVAYETSTKYRKRKEMKKEKISEIIDKVTAMILKNEKEEILKEISEILERNSNFSNIVIID